MANSLGLTEEEVAVLKKILHKVVGKYVDFIVGKYENVLEPGKD